MRVVAPHLVRRLPFLFPVYERGPYRAFTIQTGLWLYSTLARERLGGLVPPERSLRSIPPLRLEGLRGCGLYADAWTHDSRLCLANVRAAADAGATVLNYAEVTELRSEGGRVAGAEVRDLLGGETASVSARVVVNATGPWVDRLRRLEDPAAAPSIRLSKGAHAILRLEQPWSAALTIPHDTVRVSFAVPWEGHAPPRHDRHALRGRARRRRGDSGGHRPDPRRGRRRARAGRASARRDPLGVRGAARPSRRRRSDRQREAGDRLPTRPGRDAHRRGRQAHDLPADRARRAPAGARRPRAAPPPRPAPCPCPEPRDWPRPASASPARTPISSPRSARIWPTCTGASPPRSSRKRPTIHLSSSASTPRGRTSPPRPSTRSGANGHASRRTSSGGARLSSCAACGRRGSSRKSSG